MLRSNRVLICQIRSSVINNVGNDLESIVYYHRAGCLWEAICRQSLNDAKTGFMTDVNGNPREVSNYGIRQEKRATISGTRLEKIVLDMWRWLVVVVP